MAKVGAKRAAELTGKSKSTIQRAMNSGKISYELDANDRRVVDVSELERVFGLDGVTSGSGDTDSAVMPSALNAVEMERMKMKIKMLEQQVELAQEQIEDLKEQRDQWQKQASQVLITSQYSQKQAEELKEQLEARKRKARMRRQKRLQQKMQNMSPQNENRQGTGQDAGSSFSFGDLWKRARKSA